MASTIMANAFVFHEALANGPGPLANVASLDQLRGRSGGLSKSIVLAEWATILKVNFDKQKDVLRTFRVAQQSTFIVYRGKEEVARSTGDTRKDSIAATLRKGLS